MNAVLSTDDIQPRQEWPVRLRRVQPEANMHRHYTVGVEQDLFGAIVVTCRWGRVGRAGQMREHVCVTRTSAEALARCLVAKKLGRGYEIEGDGVAAARVCTTARAHRFAGARMKAGKVPRGRQGPGPKERQLSLFSSPITTIEPASATTSRLAPDTATAVSRAVNVKMQSLGRPSTRVEQERAFKMLTLAASLRGLPLMRGMAPRSLSAR